MTKRPTSRHTHGTPLTHGLAEVCLAAALLLAATGCENEKTQLTLTDLSGDEYRYVERMVVLERAKAVALIDRPAGDALLDSLAAAWGDSSLVETGAGAPGDPVRSEAVATLLRRVLAAERDSFMAAPRADRLQQPLMDPPPPVPDRPPEGEKEPET